MNSSLQQIHELFQSRRQFAVISHINPDGDAYGTSLGLAWTLKAMGKEVRVLNQDGMLPNFRYLPGADWVEPTPEGPLREDWPLLAVDTSTYDRLGAKLVRTGRRPDLNLDHHATNEAYGQHNWIIRDSPASAQVLAELIHELGLPLTREAAINLYVGLMTDTGSFRYRGTSPATFTVAARLVGAGADPSYLADQSYRRAPLGEFKLMREVLNVTEFYADYRIATYTLTSEMFERTGTNPDQVEGFLDMLQTVETVEVAFMLQALPDGVTRVSLRSRARIDVSELAAQIGGGGHKLAAGARSTLPLAEVKARLLQSITESLGSLASV